MAARAQRSTALKVDSEEEEGPVSEEVEAVAIQAEPLETNRVSEEDGKKMAVVVVDPSARIPLAPLQRMKETVGLELHSSLLIEASLILIKEVCPRQFHCIMLRAEFEVAPERLLSLVA